MTAPFDRAAAERCLGPAAVQAIRDLAAAAPPMRAETRMQLRAVFASAPPASREPEQLAA
ncbi:hypothetical protein ACFWA6_18230 [Streptomyces sp. NPDC060020]|uniref:hypothetical protein n=1 Tax=Streptomyces sp. NPDC060020 TaxID=3347038 RepID=UPI0036BC226F